MEQQSLQLKSLSQIIQEADPRSRSHYKNWKEAENKLVQRGLAASLQDFYLHRYHQGNSSANDLDRELGFYTGTTRRILTKMGFPIKSLSELKKGSPFPKTATENSAESNRLLSDEDKQILVELITEELNLFKAGKVNRITTNYELSELIGCSHSYVGKFIKLLTEKDRLFRTKIFYEQKNKKDAGDIQAFKDLALEEFQFYQSGNLARPSTIDELIELTGWTNSTIKKYLKELGEDFYKKRRKILSRNVVSVSHPDDRKAMIDLIREELRLYDEDKLERLTENEEWAEILGISTASLSRHLRKGLTNDERKKRKAAITSFHATKRLEGLTDDEHFVLCSNAGKRNYELHGNPADVMTTEQRKEIGKDVFRKYGCPLLKLSDEDRGDVLRRAAATRMIKYGTMFPGKSDEEILTIRRANGRKVGRINGRKIVETLRKNSYFVEERFYSSSQQEGAVALLLEKYLPSYRVKDGENFQVRQGIDNGGIDFLVEDEFFEWHPIILSGSQTKRGDIPRKDYPAFQRYMHALKEERKREFQNGYKRVLGVNYCHQRQEDVDNSEYSGRTVHLATNEQELYDFIQRHSTQVVPSTPLPPLTDFKREFRKTCKYVKGFRVEPKQQKVLGV